MSNQISALEAQFLMAVEGATWSARVNHPKLYVSRHQSYAILLEELDEYWDEVKKKQSDPALLLHELIDLAAVCVRAATEVVMPRMDQIEALDSLNARRLGVPCGNLKLKVEE